jgi:hypothetical protein
VTLSVHLIKGKKMSQLDVTFLAVIATSVVVMVAWVGTAPRLLALRRVPVSQQNQHGEHGEKGYRKVS